jgi:3-oxoadipate enol-lactonase
MPLIQAGNVRLNVVERGSGTPLVLVHGYPLDHSMWQGQLDELADAARMIALDLRGFGASDVVPGTATMQQMADDVAALLDALKIAEPVVFCGLSMGGYVAWQFALRHRSRLAKLIVCDTKAAADSPEAASGRRQTADKVLAEGPAAVAEALLPKLFAPATSDRQPQVIAATKRVILQTKPDGIAAALRGMAERPDVTSQLGTIDVPVLVLCGEHDGISPPDEMRQMAAALPQAAFTLIQDAGHMTPLEQPAAVNDEIRAFLAR